MSPNRTEAEIVPEDGDSPLIGVKLSFAYVMPDAFLTLPYNEYTEAVDRQLEVMKRELYNKAKDEWFHRQALYTTPQEFTKD